MDSARDFFPMVLYKGVPRRKLRKVFLQLIFDKPNESISFFKNVKHKTTQNNFLNKVVAYKNALLSNNNNTKSRSDISFYKDHLRNRIRSHIDGAIAKNNFLFKHFRLMSNKQEQNLSKSSELFRMANDSLTNVRKRIKNRTRFALKEKKNCMSCNYISRVRSRGKSPTNIMDRRKPVLFNLYDGFNTVSTIKYEQVRPYLGTFIENNKIEHVRSVKNINTRRIKSKGSIKNETTQHIPINFESAPSTNQLLQESAENKKTYEQSLYAMAKSNFNCEKFKTYETPNTITHNYEVSKKEIAEYFMNESVAKMNTKIESENLPSVTKSTENPNHTNIVHSKKIQHNNSLRKEKNTSSRAYDPPKCLPDLYSDFKPASYKINDENSSSKVQEVSSMEHIMRAFKQRRLGTGKQKINGQSEQSPKPCRSGFLMANDYTNLNLRKQDKCKSEHTITKCKWETLHSKCRKSNYNTVNTKTFQPEPEVTKSSIIKNAILQATQLADKKAIKKISPDHKKIKDIYEIASNSNSWLQQSSKDNEVIVKQKSVHKLSHTGTENNYPSSAKHIYKVPGLTKISLARYFMDKVSAELNSVADDSRNDAMYSPLAGYQYRISSDMSLPTPIEEHEFLDSRLPTSITEKTYEHRNPRVIKKQNTQIPLNQNIFKLYNPDGSHESTNPDNKRNNNLDTGKIETDVRIKKKDEYINSFYQKRFKPDIYNVRFKLDSSENDWYSKNSEMDKYSKFAQRYFCRALENEAYINENKMNIKLTPEPDHKLFRSLLSARQKTAANLAKHIFVNKELLAKLEALKLTPVETLEFVQLMQRVNKHKPHLHQSKEFNFERKLKYNTVEKKKPDMNICINKEPTPTEKHPYHLKADKCKVLTSLYFAEDNKHGHCEYDHLKRWFQTICDTNKNFFYYSKPLHGKQNIKSSIPDKILPNRYFSINRDNK